MLTLAQQSLAQAQGMAGIRSDALGQRQNLGLEIFGSTDLLHKPPFKRLCRINSIPGKRHQTRLGNTDNPGQQPGTAITGNNTEFDEAFSEQRLAAGITNVAHAGRIQTGTDARPVDGRNDRNIDRKSTRLNSSHVRISYAVFCLKKKKKKK